MTVALWLLSGCIAWSLALPALAASQQDASDNPKTWHHQAAAQYFDTTEKKYQVEITPKSYRTLPIEVNDDKQPEIFYIATDSFYCGAQGCSLGILQKQGGQWVAILNDVIGNEVQVLNSKTKGYRNLTLNGKTIWKWNGKTYNP